MTKSTLNVFEVIEEAFLPTEWIVEGLWPSEDSLMIYGPSKAGKSYLTLDLTLHIAYGIDWHGHVIERPRKALYIPSEGRRGTYRRALAWLQYHDWMGPYLDDQLDILRIEHGDRFGWEVIHPDLWLLLDTPSGMEALERIVSEGGFEIVVFDVLRDFATTIDENGRGMGDLIKSVSFDRIGATPLMIHHTGLNDQRRPRGSSSITASNDIEIAVTGTTFKTNGVIDYSILLITNEKQKNEDPFDDFRLRLERVGDLAYPVITGVDNVVTQFAAYTDGLTEGDRTVYAFISNSLTRETFTRVDLETGIEWFDKGNWTRFKKRAEKAENIRHVTTTGQTKHYRLTDSFLDKYGAQFGNNE